MFDGKMKNYLFLICKTVETVFWKERFFTMFLLGIQSYLLKSVVNIFFLLIILVLFEL